MIDRRLQHVVAVAKEGSFTKAAEKVGLTQSGITRSIADLERELGYLLFHRTARGTMPTEQGRHFAERAGRLVDDARALFTRNVEHGDPFATTLRIGVCPASLEWLLARPLAGLLGMHPSMRFEVVGSIFERTVQLLRTGSLDIAIGFDEAFSPLGDVERETIGAFRAVLFVRKDHRLMTSGVTSERDLVASNWILPSESRPYADVVRRLFDQANMSWHRHVHIVENFTVVRRIVASSDSFGITTEDYARSASFRRAFGRVPGASPFPPALLCSAVRSRWLLPPPVKALRRALRDLIPVAGELA